MERIQSVQNPKVKNWVKLLTKKGRLKEGLFLIEGEHLIDEALKSNVSLECLIVHEETESKYTPLFNKGDIPVYSVTEAVMKKITDTDTPQGICAVVRIEKNQKKDFIHEDSILLILDAVQDPGNLGTIIRTADAAGIDGIILGHGTVDLYNPKTIRSTMGSIFHIPIIEEELSETLPFLQERGFRLIATSLEGSVPYDQPLYDGSVALIIGNEGNGVSEQWLAQCDAKVKIPIYGKAESLNASIAAGIITYEAIRQRKHSCTR